MFNNSQKEAIQKQTLLMFTNFLLQKNGEVTSKELKDHVHKINANTQFENGEFTQKMASDFLKEYFNNANGNIVRELRQVLNFEFFVYKKKEGITKSINEALPNPNRPSTFDVNLGAVVCYNKNNPSEYIQANTRKEARTKCRKQFNITNADHVNTCSAEYYKKKYATQAKAIY